MKRAIRSHFDGSQILTPPELLGLSARDVLIVIDDQAAPPQDAPESVWDVVSSVPARPARSGEEIIAELRRERDAWGDR